LQHEWPYRFERETADEQEREVTGIGEPVAEYLECPFAVQLIES
jgi:hypothetical protein